MTHFLSVVSTFSGNGTSTHLVFVFSETSQILQLRFIQEKLFLFFLLPKVKQLTSLFSGTCSSMTKKREALPQRGQRGRRKLGGKKGGGIMLDGRQGKRWSERWKGSGKATQEVEKEAERESDRQTDHRWRRTTGTNFAWRLFLLLLAGRTGAACGSNHPPNTSW